MSAVAPARPVAAVAHPRGGVSAFRRVRRALAFALLGFAGAIALALAAPLAFGYQTFTILSGSMAPAIATGDIVVVDKISPLDARVGDVVSFRSPEVANKIVTHRVVRMAATPDGVRFVTRGDANTGVERWAVAKNGTIGRVEYRVPKLGYVANRVGSRLGRFTFIVVPALLLALSELWRIWRPAGREQTDGTRA